MQSTMQDRPLTINAILRHGARVYAGSEVVTWTGESARRATFAETSARAEKLAAALRRLGIREGDRVGTFAWNNQEHLEAYLAVPASGAVLHTLNIRLFPEQLIYVVNHAEDRVVIVDASLVSLLARVAKDLRTVEHFIVVGESEAASGLGNSVLRYEDLLAAEAPGFAWPELDERAAAAMCYTSGTTGNPKGVVYSHRSTYLHAVGLCMANSFGFTEHDRTLAVVPMFHANAWGMPYAAWFTGASLLLPDRFLQAERLARFIEAERPTISGAVPTVWNELLRYSETHEVDLSSLRIVVCGGAAVPPTLMRRYEERHGLRIIQAWGMTETSPLGAIAHPPHGIQPDEEMSYRTKSGRVAAGIEARIMDGERELPWDGAAVGEIEVRGAWVAGGYYGDDAPEKFHDGWLRTGDIGTLDAKGFIQLTDRSKDVIKSGGEWISSVELENELMAHAAVLEAAVISVPDERWDERPLACVVLREGAGATHEELREFLSIRVAKWWVPERWAFVAEIPKTSVGKFDKKVLRARRESGELGTIHETAPPPPPKR
ncbi:MAG: long-chain fatty acid--CoA ligase [Acidobacteriota bacterium]|nr:long-chain fatty acid--CoA ligase [Acidobacteriota bacterium]